MLEYMAIVYSMQRKSEICNLVKMKLQIIILKMNIIMLIPMQSLISNFLSLFDEVTQPKINLQEKINLVPKSSNQLYKSTFIKLPYINDKIFQYMFE